MALHGPLECTVKTTCTLPCHHFACNNLFGATGMDSVPYEPREFSPVIYPSKGTMVPNWETLFLLAAYS